MRAQKLIFSVLLLIVLISCVSATDNRDRNFNVQVNKVNSESDPISGATVTLSREDTGASFDLSPTDSSGKSTTKTININVQDPPRFTVRVSAQGYENGVFEHLTFSEAVLETSKTFIVQLTPQGATSGASGLIINEELAINRACSPGYTETGQVQDTVFQNDVYKLCVQYTNNQNFTSGAQYVNFSYLGTPQGEKNCVLGGSAVGSFNTMEGVRYLCVSKNPMTDMTRDQFVYKSLITSNLADCSGFEKISDPFTDRTNQPKYYCARIQNYHPANEGDCIIQNPKWLDKNRVEVTAPVEGTDSTDDKTLPGEQEIYLSVNAPAACREITGKITFEIYEGSGDVWDLKQTLSNSAWQAGTGDNPSILYIRWAPVWFKETGPGADAAKPRQYKFKTKISSTSQQTDYSNELIVNPPKPIECDPAGDGSECEDGEVCQAPGMCVAECTSNDECEQGFCDTESGKCIECAKQEDCAASTQFGEGYICDLTEGSETKNKCVYNGECKLTNLRWKGSSENDLVGSDGFKGFIDDDNYQCGQKITLVADAQGCKGKTVNFYIYESNGILDQPINLKATHLGDTVRYQGWEPQWNPTIQQALQGKFSYFFTAVVEEDPQKTETDPSSELIVVKPKIRECMPNANPEIDCVEKHDNTFVCGECGVCEKQCGEDNPCENGKICDMSSGRCVECLSNIRCESASPDKPICDLQDGSETKNKCVECLSADDCQDKTGKTCFENQCTDRCTPDTQEADCTEANKKICDGDNSVCVQCKVDNDCGFLTACENNTCASGGGFGGNIMTALIMGVIGYMTMGPMGALMGLMALMGGGSGGLGGLGGLLGGLV